MTTYYRAVAISEDVDPDQHTDDCVWCSGLRQANANSGGKHPPTLAEAEAIELAAGGPFLGGSNSAELVLGLTRRYGFTPTIVLTPAGIVAAAKPGQSLTVSGHLSNFPAGHHLRRYSPTFTGGHRISVDVEDGPKYWWVDPLAPPNTGPLAGYVGEYVTLAELTTFAQGGSGGTVAPLHLITPPKKALKCPGSLKATPANSSATLVTLRAGQYVEILGTVNGLAWSFLCNGARKTGNSWYHADRGSGLVGYIPTGYF